MQLHPTSRSRRVRRLLAVSAAAVAVMIAPTACDYGGAAQMDMPTHSGHIDGMNMDDRPSRARRQSTRSVRPSPTSVPRHADPDGRRRRRRRPRPPRAVATTGAAATTAGEGAARSTSRRRSRPRPATGSAAPTTATTPRRQRERVPRHRQRARRPPRRRRQQRARRPRPGLLEEQTDGRTTASRTSPACVSTRDGRDRGGEQAAVPADHRRAAARRRQPAVQARGQHPQPGARPVPRRRRGRLLPGELVPQRTRACSAGTSTPPAGSSRRPAQAPDSSASAGVLPRHAGQRRRRGAGHRDDQRARRHQVGRRAAVHLVGR